MIVFVIPHLVCSSCVLLPPSLSTPSIVLHDPIRLSWFPWHLSHPLHQVFAIEFIVFQFQTCESFLFYYSAYHYTSDVFLVFRDFWSISDMQIY